MNYMRQIADMLGIKVGEEFKIRDKYGSTIDKRYFIDRKGFWEVGGGLNYSASKPLLKLLTGKWDLVKLPWKPKEGDRAYFVMSSGMVDSLFYSENGVLSLLAQHAGLLYRTEEEAERNKDKAMKFWDEVKKEIDER